MIERSVASPLRVDGGGDGGTMRKATWATAAFCLLLTLACSSASKNFGSATGRVLDSRTHKPVVGANVGDGVASARTDSAGRFALHDVPKIARLTVSAINYRSANAAASAHDTDIFLAPVPVTGMVRSGLTNLALVGASVQSGSLHSNSDAAGQFTLYGVGPGAKVAVSAKGYLPTATTFGDTRTASVTLKPTDATLRARDLPLIKSIWRNNSDAWGDGGNAGQVAATAFDTANNYPGVDGNLAKCDPDRSAGYTEEYVLDESSVQRDDGWVMTFGALRGQTPKGRIYIMKVTTSFSNGLPQQLDELHVTLLDGKPYFFYFCDA
jgi:hypothetical protein